MVLHLCKSGAPGDQGEKSIKLIDSLNDNGDVQNVHASFEVSDTVVAGMRA
jgi:transcriptional/translational regulatory protein YebC/TACO1